MKIFVVVVFLLTYTSIVLFNRRLNPLVSVFSGIAILLVFQAIGVRDAFLSVNFNVLGVFLGTMILSGLFIYSNVPGFLASRLVGKSKNVSAAILFMCLLASFISSFTENVATVLIVAPIAFEVAKKLKANPIPFLIGIAISSNLQGSATMIGDSPSIILAMSHRMNFMDFFWMKGRPGIAFAVEIGAVASFIVLYLLFKKYKQGVQKIEEIKIKTWVPTILMTLMIVSLGISSFIQNKPYHSIALICLSFGAIGLLWHKLFAKEQFSFTKNIDWRTFFFLIGVFVLIGALSHVGVIQDIAGFISNLTAGNIFLTFTLIVWISVLCSAFIDNIPYVIAMIPVANILASDMGARPELFLFGLLIGATLGGNITPIGASANIVSMGMLRDRGYKVSFLDFLKIGLPFTLVAVTFAYLFLYLTWR
ncbi:MAG: TRAP transporter large permease subunit [Candidatus Omnitrophica bacterium]|nr:TRAP transporter large permease subunit [Candidatus Omnitrophota bacterium]